MTSELVVRGVRYHAAQMQVLDEAGKVNILQCGRRWGKTTLFVGMAIDAMMRGERAGYWVPVLGDAKDVWDAVLKRLGHVVASANKIERRVRTLTGGVLDVWPLDQDGAGRGYRYDLALVDEGAKARRLGSAVDETIRPALLDRGGVLWVASTPRGVDDFARLGLRARTDAGRRDGWRWWRMPTSANPRMPADELVRIERELVDRGKRWVWEQEYLGVPSDNGVHPYGLDLVRRQTQAEVTGVSPVVWGLDLAKSVDWTVLVGVGQDGRIAAMHRWQREPYTVTAERVAAVVGKVPVWADATGVGDAVCDMLDRLGVGLTRYVFTAASRQRLLERLEEGLQDGWAWVLDGQMLVEVESLEYAVHAGAVRYEVPGKGDGEQTDDAVMAAALSYWGWRELGYPRSAPRSGGVISHGAADERRRVF